MVCSTHQQSTLACMSQRWLRKRPCTKDSRGCWLGWAWRTPRRGLLELLLSPSSAVSYLLMRRAVARYAPLNSGFWGLGFRVSARLKDHRPIQKRRSGAPRGPSELLPPSSSAVSYLLMRRAVARYAPLSIQGFGV